MYCIFCGKEILDGDVCTCDQAVDQWIAQQERKTPVQKFSVELVRLAASGDNEACSQIYYQTHPRAYAIAKSIVKDHFDAMDVMQDCYITLYQKIGTLKDPDKLEAWFAAIVHNRSIDLLRKKKAQVFSDINEASGDPDFDYEETIESEYWEFSPEASVDYAETKRLLWGIVDTLPEKQKLCVKLRWGEGLKTREIAQRTGLSESTVKSCLNYGHKKIEAGVRELEKHGTKLYSITPLTLIPFLRWMLGGSAPVAVIQEAAFPAATAAASATVVGSSAAAASAAGTGAVAMATATAAKTGAAIGAKQLIAGICAAAALTVGTAVVPVNDGNTILDYITGSAYTEETVVTEPVVETTLPPTVPPTTEPPTEPTEVIETTIVTEPPVGAVEDYVITALEGEYRSGNKEYICQYPQLTMDWPEAQRINGEIEQQYGEFAAAIASGEGIDPYWGVDRWLEYRAWLSDSVLVLEVKFVNDYSGKFTYYSIDVLTGEIVDSADVIANCGVDEDTLYSLVAQAAEELYRKDMQSAGWIYNEDLLARTIAVENLKNAVFSYGKDGGVLVCYKVYFAAGGGSGQDRVTVYPEG